MFLNQNILNLNCFIHLKFIQCSMCKYVSFNFGCVCCIVWIQLIVIYSMKHYYTNLAWHDTWIQSLYEVNHSNRYHHHHLDFRSIRLPTNCLALWAKNGHMLPNGRSCRSQPYTLLFRFLFNLGQNGWSTREIHGNTTALPWKEVRKVQYHDSTSSLIVDQTILLSEATTCPV